VCDRCAVCGSNPQVAGAPMDGRPKVRALPNAKPSHGQRYRAVTMTKGDPLRASTQWWSRR
ncbi:MAG: hypothetical protein N3A53_07565, partial [Verrucomicrobiae bacterium]|nr:hypothetical protein [Verrucomicrobiae bacterium]